MAMICEDCHGTKVISALVNRGRLGCNMETIQCFGCRGAGEVPDEAVVWKKVGALLRTHRVEQGVSQRDMSVRIGLDMVALSKMEGGLIDPSQYLAAYNMGRTLGAPCAECGGKGYGHFPSHGMEAGDHVPCPKCQSASVQGGTQMTTEHR